MNDYNEFPHSPFVKARETQDHGFSKGWGFHFQPSEEYWVDCHNHLASVQSQNELAGILDRWFEKLEAYRLGKVLAITGEPESFKILNCLKSQDERLDWIFSMSYDMPDTGILNNAISNGAVGLKLHNSQIMEGKAAPEIWLEEKWRKVLKLAEEHQLPVLWHVTQRTGYSPYHGGGKNSYWSEGWKKGVTFTNEDLLQVTLEVLRRHPGLKIIGAHQLHLGLDRLSELMDRYDNLFIDTSCGFYLRWADILYDEDRRRLRDFSIKYRGRILFGTDSELSAEAGDEYGFQGFLCHTRFVLQLNLPYDVLQEVSHLNAERLFRLRSIVAKRRGNVRP